MHPTITRFMEIVKTGNEEDLKSILADNVAFSPPTYFATWTGKEPVAAVLSHVGNVFSNLTYPRVMGSGNDWALEFNCKVGDLDAVGVDLLTLNDEGLIVKFEVCMRPYKSIGALREAMNAAVSTDERFLKFRESLS